MTKTPLQEKIKVELDNEYIITDKQIDFFLKNGFIKLRNVLSTELLEYYGKKITSSVIELNTLHIQMEKRISIL